jgi:hypothetical protein
MLLKPGNNKVTRSAQPLSTKRALGKCESVFILGVYKGTVLRRLRDDVYFLSPPPSLAMMAKVSLIAWVLLATSVLASDDKKLRLLGNPLYGVENPEKVFATSQNSGALNSGYYPEYTTPDGKWVWVSSSTPAGWSSGFFPSMLYLMAERETLCPGLAPNVDWITLGRAWNTPLLQLQSKNTIQSAIGMAAFPFMDEIKQ